MVINPKSDSSFCLFDEKKYLTAAAVVPKQTFLSTSRYFFKTHCVFLELLTPLFVDLSFCNSTPHWDHTGQISILKVHLEVFFPLIKSQLDGWKNICVDIHNNQQFWIQEDGLEYIQFLQIYLFRITPTVNISLLPVQSFQLFWVIIEGSKNADI